MSQPENQSDILNYIQETRFSLLTYVRSDLTPVSRAIGSFALDGTGLFFSTGKENAKVREIENHKRVSFYFEHDNQNPASWKSVLLIGDAEQVNAGSATYDNAVARLSAKSPRFRERIANGERESVAIYRINTSEFEYLDRSKGNGPARKIFLR
jgi:nitroimidazol reductase NimA-like FMN-containing flavoprotein (pyridoxamine 5'-phosphate oxidase superfamily)